MHGPSIAPKQRKGVWIAADDDRGEAQGIAVVIDGFLHVLDQEDRSCAGEPCRAVVHGYSCLPVGCCDSVYRRWRRARIVIKSWWRLIPHPRLSQILIWVIRRAAPSTETARLPRSPAAALPWWPCALPPELPPSPPPRSAPPTHRRSPGSQARPARRQ